MSFGRRVITSLMLGYAAFAMARGVGIPAWQDWPTHDVPADASDIAVLVTLALFQRGKPKEAGHG